MDHRWCYQTVMCIQIRDASDETIRPPPGVHKPKLCATKSAFTEMRPAIAPVTRIIVPPAGSERGAGGAARRGGLGRGRRHGARGGAVAAVPLRGAGRARQLVRGSTGVRKSQTQTLLLIPPDAISNLPSAERHDSWQRGLGSVTEGRIGTAAPRKRPPVELQHSPDDALADNV